MTLLQSNLPYIISFFITKINKGYQLTKKETLKSPTALRQPPLIFFYASVVAVFFARSIPDSSGLKLSMKYNLYHVKKV